MRNNMNDPRTQMVEWLGRELIGPDMGDDEILTSDPPLVRYGVGILFPPATSSTTEVDTRSTDQAQMDLEKQEATEVDALSANSVDSLDSNWQEDDAYDDNEVDLSNDNHQSAMGLSIYVHIPSSGLAIRIKAGRYIKEKTVEVSKRGNRYEKASWHRQSLDTTVIMRVNEIPKLPGQSKEAAVMDKELNSGLHVHIRCRAYNEKTGRVLLTCTLINKGDGSSTKSSDINERSWFQCSMQIKACDVQPFVHPYPEGKRIVVDEDSRSNKLLFRNHHTWAVGHGCATKWSAPIGDVVDEVSTSTMPKYEMKPVVPRTLPSVMLDMQLLGDAMKDSEADSAMGTLCQEYRNWIQDQETELSNDYVLMSDMDYLNTARTHLDNCKQCLKRMEQGLRRLQTSNIVRKAFRLMNRAMLTQQLHYALKTRKWEYIEETEAWTIARVAMLDENDRSTWPGQPGRYGAWRPFQLAFILMNLVGMDDPLHPEHNIVDLIWFPTGGGKTEAYLGLTAYTLFLRRLKNNNDDGTAVIMRYTLRLLTMQQYERAASLICACEKLRQENIKELGTNRITAGLWIGQSTPTTSAEAVTEFNKMYQSKQQDNPFVILKCPWCGAQMGIAKDSNGQKTKVRGYTLKKIKGKSHIAFQCDDPTCDFSKEENQLPLYVVDEDIYNTPPSLLFGTVDKFAMIPWRGEARKLFGLDPSKRRTPPELIIQDELHLISGPLGSMVGHYETLIDALCSRSIKDQSVRPKIIASTATISRAREQTNALYNCGKHNVFIFPPQCLETNESFFAQVDHTAPGRLYIGVHPSAMPSQATAQTRIISSLLQSVKLLDVKEERDRDPYWTIMYYFNSLRELGHAETLLLGDIPQYLNALYLRYDLKNRNGKDTRRFVNNAIELTSRITNSQVPEYLHALETAFDSSKEWQQAIDVCLATNMISVGLDVSRLGLMAVVGQPKTTSEYIQATSRVGRSNDGPGLVITIYNASKPRDRSHYEHFVSYHDTIYSKVEPTSITSFSAPVRERALHAVLVGLVRMMGTDGNNTSPRPLPDSIFLKEIQEIIRRRVAGVDPEEQTQTMKLLEKKLREWEGSLPPVYGGFGKPSVTDVPLMFPAGMKPLDAWGYGGPPWFTQSSMRNVDAECEAVVCSAFNTTDDGSEN